VNLAKEVQIVSLAILAVMMSGTRRGATTQHCLFLLTGACQHSWDVSLLNADFVAAAQVLIYVGAECADLVCHYVGKQAGGFSVHS